MAWFFSANFEDCVALAIRSLIWCGGFCILSLVMFWIIVMHVLMSGEIARYIEELCPLERERKRVGKRYADNRRKASRDFCNKPAYV